MSDSDTSDSSDDASVTAAPAASRLGLFLFLIYTLLYLGFVFINAFSADTMDTLLFAGLNLAIVYGFGLIVAAIVLAFIYGFALRGNQSDAVESDSASTGESV